MQITEFYNKENIQVKVLETFILDNIEFNIVSWKGKQNTEKKMQSYHSVCYDGYELIRRESWFEADNLKNLFIKNYDENKTDLQKINNFILTVKTLQNETANI